MRCELLDYETRRPGDRYIPYHADDETLGLGGCIARYATEGHPVGVAVITGDGSERVRGEARQACSVLGPCGGCVRDAGLGAQPGRAVCAVG